MPPSPRPSTAQQQQQQQQPREATPGPSSVLDQSSSPSASSSQTKLDAVLYNFYSKSVNLVAANRLTHQTFTSTDSNNARVVNKWFALPLPDLDIFKDELRLWRSLSAFVPPSALEASIETPAEDAAGAPLTARVPPLVLDVIFEPVKAPAVATPPRPLILERWRIDFTVFQPEAPPDLQDLYKRCTAHLHAFDAATRNLPAYKLHSRIRGKEAGLGHIGCRLGAGEVEEAETPSGSERRELGLDSASSSQTGLHGFAPLLTPLGSLTVSVEYRENLSMAGDVRPDDLRPDEDYFKPPTPQPQPQPAAPRSGSSFSDRPSPPPSLAPASPSPSSFGRIATTPGAPRAGLSALRNQPAHPSSSSDATPLSSSPGAGEPAFLTSHARRTSSSSVSSNSERRFRTASILGPAGSSGSGSGIAEHSPVGGVLSAARPSLPQQMRFGSYSPSSPSPLAQQVAEGGSASSHRSLRSTATTSAATAAAKSSSTPPSMSHSLRSIFQHYVPANLAGASGSPASNSSVASLSGAAGSPRPTMRRAGSGGASGSYESTTAARIEPGSSVPSSSSASRPSVSPQMIQRYSRTPSYRSQQRGGGSGSLESGGGSGDPAGSGSGGAPRSSSSFSRSWQARTEARQQAAMMMAASGSGTVASRGSPSSLLSRASPGSLISRDSPPMPSSVKRSSAASGGGVGRRDSIDDLVSLIESRPILAQQPAGTSGLPTSSSSSSPLAADGQPSSSSGTFPPTRPSPNPAVPQPQPPAGLASSTSSAASSRILLSTSAMDDMLAKMTQSVQRLVAPPPPPATTRATPPATAAATRPLNSLITAPKSSSSDTDPSSSSSAAAPARLGALPPLAAEMDPTDDSSFEGGHGAVLRGRPYAARRGASGGSRAVRLHQHEEVDAILLQPHDDEVEDVPLDDYDAQQRTSSSQPRQQPLRRNVALRREGSEQGATATTTSYTFDVGYNDAYEDEEEHPAGRLELHSDPATPTSLRYSSSPGSAAAAAGAYRLVGPAARGGGPGVGLSSRDASRTRNRSRSTALRTSAGSDVDELATAVQPAQPTSNLFAHRSMGRTSGGATAAAAAATGSPGQRRFRRYVSGFDVGGPRGTDDEVEEVGSTRGRGASGSSAGSTAAAAIPGGPWASYGLGARRPPGPAAGVRRASPHHSSQQQNQQEQQREQQRWWEYQRERDDDV